MAIFPLSPSEPVTDVGAWLQYLENEETLALYANALELQMELNRPLTKKFLGDLEAWKNAKTILDVGCGVGSFPAHHAEVLKGKSYVGIDREPRFIETAISHNLGSSHTFSCEDALTYAGKQFDLILAQAVLQHLPSVKIAAEHFFSLVRPNGHLLVFDTYEDATLEFQPAIRSVSVLYKNLAKMSRSRGRNNECLKELKHLAPAMGIPIACEMPVEIQISKPSEKSCLIRYVSLVRELLVRLYDIRSDRTQIVRDLMSWESHDGSTSQWFGGGWLLLKTATTR